MKVRAIEMGFAGGFRRRAGQVFDLPAGLKLPKWCVSVELDSVDQKPAKAEKTGKPAKAEPETLSEIARAEPPSLKDA